MSTGGVKLKAAPMSTMFRLCTLAILYAGATLSAQFPACNTFESCRNSAQAFLDQRRHSEALRDWESALLLARNDRSPKEMAIAYRGIGLCNWRVDQLKKALENYESGLEQANLAPDKALEAELLRGIAVVRRALGDFAVAIATDERSVALYRELGDTRLTAYGLDNLALNYHRLGDLSQAVWYYEQALQLGKDYADVVSFVSFNLGNVAREQGNSESAHLYFDEALRSAEKRNDKHGIALALANLGPLNNRLGRTDRALADYERAMKLARETDDIRLQAVILVNRAHVHVLRKEYDLAAAALRQEIALFEKGDSLSQASVALSNLAHIEAESGNNEQGLAHAERAVAIGKQYDSPELLWQAYEAVAVCERGLKHPDAARRAYEQSIEQVESWRLRLGGSESDGRAFLSDKVAPYHGLERMLIEHGQPAQALEVAERAKARQLLDVIRGGKAEITSLMTPEERAQEAKLSAGAGGLNRQLGRARSTEERAKLRGVWEETTRALEEFYRKLYATHPGLAARRGDAAPISLARMKDLLPDSKTLLIEYTVDDDRVYVFAIDRPADAPRLRTHALFIPRADLQHQVDSFQRQLGERDLGYRKDAAALYTRILGTLTPELQGKTSLIIVPDGPLWNLSFQALIRPDGRHVLEHTTIFYAPSFTFLVENRRLRGSVQADRKVLAVGNPASADLPLAAREVREVVHLYGPDQTLALTGDNAPDKETWMSEAPRYRVLHLATHGVLNPRNPLYSYLELAPRPGRNDSVLEAREVAKMTLHADIAVLSACEMARGEVSDGEGLIGMGWAFLLAGAPTTVLSQWKVDSEATMQLMLGFHRLLKPVLDGGAPFARARALQQAAVAVMRMPEYRHPFYWAAFVMVGDGY